MCLAWVALAAACATARPADPPAAPPLKEVGEARAKALPRRELPELPDLPQYCHKAEDLAKEAKATEKTAPRDAPSKSSGGRLPPELIQKIVRTHYGVFRACYEAGLKKNPDLYGRVSTRFIIERDGQVRRSDPDCSSMPDPEVVRCVVEGYKTLSFPEPEGGIVTVVYPIMFSPGD
jgi:hypothetical protein